jgi:hypothetical protein
VPYLGSGLMLLSAYSAFRHCDFDAAAEYLAPVVMGMIVGVFAGVLGVGAGIAAKRLFGGAKKLDKAAAQDAIRAEEKALGKTPEDIAEVRPTTFAGDGPGAAPNMTPPPWVGVGLPPTVRLSGPLTRAARFVAWVQTRRCPQRSKPANWLMMRVARGCAPRGLMKRPTRMTSGTLTT